MALPILLGLYLLISISQMSSSGSQDSNIFNWALCLAGGVGLTFLGVYTFIPRVYGNISTFFPSHSTMLFFLFLVAAFAIALMIILASNANDLSDNSLPVISPSRSITPKRTPLPVPTPPPDVSPETLDKLDWFQFEKLMELMFMLLNYRVTRFGGANPDGGVDLIIEKDGVATAVQCKHWKNWKTGVSHVREFFGALQDRQIHSGIFICTSDYSADARQFAARNRIELWDKAKILHLLKDSRAALSPAFAHLVSDKSKRCPKCESKMILRVSRKGPNAGQNFWGCSRYPRCHFTMPFTIPTGKEGRPAQFARSF